MVMRVPREHPVLGEAELFSWGGELVGGILDHCAPGSLTGVLASPPSSCPHEASGPHRGGRGQQGSWGSRSRAAALGAPRAVLATRAQPQGLFLHWGFWRAVGARGLGVLPAGLGEVPGSGPGQAGLCGSLLAPCPPCPLSPQSAPLTCPTGRAASA